MEKDNGKVIVKKMQIIDDKIARYEQNIKDLRNLKKELDKTLMQGITFNPNDLVKVIATLLSIEEGRGYKARICNYAPHWHYYYAGMASLIKDRDLHPYEVHQISKGGVVVYDQVSPWESKNDTDMLMTYSFLVKKYRLKEANLTKPEGINRINFIQQNNFDNYDYVKDFICYVAELQIANNKRLSYSELDKSIDDFIDYSRVKTKELKREEI